METIQVAVAILTIMTCLFGLVAVATDYWLVNEDDTKSAGLFNKCVGVSCEKTIESKSEFINSIVFMRRWAPPTCYTLRRNTASIIKGFKDRIYAHKNFFVPNKSIRIFPA